MTTGQNRCVHFAGDEDGDGLHVSFRHYDPCTKSDVANAWYTDDEYDQFQTSVREEALLASTTEYKKHVMSVYSACGEERLEDDDVQFFASAQRRTAVLIAQSAFRGLECYQNHDHMQKLQEGAIYNILEAQEASLSSDDKHVPRHEAAG